MRRRVTTAPSGRTSYVVVGSEAGAKKLETIAKLKLKTLDETSFLDLIRTREPTLDDKQIKKKEADEKKIIEDARRMQEADKQKEKEIRAALNSGDASVRHLPLIIF